MGLLESLKFGSENDTELEEESGQTLPQDPEPGQAPARRRGRPPRRPADPGGMTTAQVNKLSKSVGADLAGLLDLGGTVWEMAGDKCCAPVLQDQSKPIGDAMAACLARNPRLLARMSDVDFVTMTLQFGMLAKALQPVVKAVWHNHISGDGSEAVNNGRGNGIDFDAFPPYPAYTA